jgi:hypothetical protein
MEFSWLVMREDERVAEKLEKMFLESFRSFGDAGDSGGCANGAFGDANSPSLKLPGDLGLLGLKGAFEWSFPIFPPLMASDNADDLGILRSCFRGGAQG